jgi:hypothetical protein
VRGQRDRFDLTKEFDLLYLLAQHPRQVFTRDQLLRTVWGNANYIDPGTVTVHIRRLREKIEVDPASPVTCKRCGASGIVLNREGTHANNTRLEKQPGYAQFLLGALLVLLAGLGLFYLMMQPPLQEMGLMTALMGGSGLLSVVRLTWATALAGSSIPRASAGRWLPVMPLPGCCLLKCLDHGPDDVPQPARPDLSHHPAGVCHRVSRWSWAFSFLRPSLPAFNSSTLRPAGWPKGS